MYFWRCMLEATLRVISIWIVDIKHLVFIDIERGNFGTHNSGVLAIAWLMRLPVFFILFFPFLSVYWYCLYLKALLWLQIREASIMVQGATVDLQRRKSKGLIFLTWSGKYFCCYDIFWIIPSIFFLSLLLASFCDLGMRFC